MCFVDMFSGNCLEAFLCIVFRRGFLLGWQPCTPIWCRVRRMVWALTGWPHHFFNLCSNADSTPLPIFQRKHLDVTLSTCAQLLWTTYTRPVLSGPRTFETLDDLSYCAATLFQGWQSSCSLGHLHGAQQYIFWDPQRVLCHVVLCWNFQWPVWESVRAALQIWTHLLPMHTWA